MAEPVAAIVVHDSNANLDLITKVLSVIQENVEIDMLMDIQRPVKED